MRTKCLFLILFVFLAVLTISTGTAFAQGVDIDQMSDEELMILQQTLIYRLQGEDSTPEAPDETPQEPEITATPTAESVPETAEVKRFFVFENKKLMVEALPSYMFIQPTQPPAPDQGQDRGRDDKKDPPVDCDHHCAYDVCPWADLKCYWYCYYSCIGEPLPDYLK